MTNLILFIIIGFLVATLINQRIQYRKFIKELVDELVQANQELNKADNAFMKHLMEEQESLKAMKKELEK